MSNVQESLQQVYSSSPPSYNFSSAKRNLHRFRMCRLHRMGSCISPLANWKLFCTGTLEHDCSATGLRAKLLRAAFGWSFGLKQTTHWDYPFLLLQDFRRCYFFFFAFFCLFVLFIHVFEKRKVFHCLWKANTQQDWNDAGKCQGISFTLPKHPKLC